MTELRARHAKWRRRPTGHGRTGKMARISRVLFTIAPGHDRFASHGQIPIVTLGDFRQDVAFTDEEKAAP